MKEAEEKYKPIIIFINAKALDKMLYSFQKYWYFSYLSTKTYVVDTQ